ncbi:GyrI-like domain-containing protein [Alkaliphilus serpentinus]|uniref:GyrI-like small molecule binding domain-containing protein n=1 Tax=Alkaliphilus serpentinus TaxID=1482731 RepID=A0A833HPL4_9FIRM|nr:hypothetical protein F8153_08445 [Alkaliphilus serpentinus]
MFEIWFQNSGYEFADGRVEFEFYDERCHSATDVIMEIYIPVVKI